MNLSLQKNIAISSLILISIPAGWKTVTRNKVWRTGPTLGMTDVHVSNYSARANTYAAANYISLIDSLKSVSEKKAYLKKAVEYCYTSQKIYPKFYTNLMLWGFAYSRLDSLDKAVWAWKLAEELQPNSEYIKTNLKIIADKYYNIGLITGANKSYDTSIYYLRKAISVYNNNADYWYNLGGAYFTTNNLDSAEVSFSNAIKLNPNHTQSIQGLQAVQSIKNQK